MRTTDRACSIIYAEMLKRESEFKQNQSAERITEMLLPALTEADIKPNNILRNEKGEVYRIVGITEDVTEHKRAEHLLEAQRDIGVALSVTNDLNAALDQLLETATNLEGIDCGGVYLVNQEFKKVKR